jgi:hypothetical protein
MTRTLHTYPIIYVLFYSLFSSRSHRERFLSLLFHRVASPTNGRFADRLPRSVAHSLFFRALSKRWTLQTSFPSSHSVDARPSPSPLPVRLSPLRSVRGNVRCWLAVGQRERPPEHTTDGKETTASCVSGS